MKLIVVKMNPFVKSQKNCHCERSEAGFASFYEGIKTECCELLKIAFTTAPLMVRGQCIKDCALSVSGMCVQFK
jgi:hypothetical protein